MRSRAGWLVPLAVLGIAYALLYRRRAWVPFVDEDDNFLGGYLIAHGERLYADYFSHHLPLPYYLAAIPAWFGVSSQVGFRIFTSALILALWAFMVLRFRARVPGLALYLCVLSIPLGFAFFWGNMLLGQAILAYCIAILLLYTYAFPHLAFPVRDQIVIAALVYFSATSTLVGVYPLGLFGVYFLLQKWRLRSAPDRRFRRRDLSLAGLIVLPFIVTGAWLWLGNTFGEFVDQAIVFNLVYYAPYEGQPLDNLRRVALEYHASVFEALRGSAIRTPDAFLAVSNVVAAVLLGWRRRVLFGVLFWLLILTSQVRSMLPVHAQSYYVLSFLGLGFVIAEVIDRLRSPAAWPGRRAVGAAWGSRLLSRVALTGGALLFAVLSLVFYGRLTLARDATTFPRDTGQRWRDMDTRVIDAVAQPGEPIWDVPLDPYEYLAAGRPLATRYAFYLPWQAASPSINARLLADLDRSQPPVVIFRTDPEILGRWQLDTYAPDATAYLKARYASVDPADPYWSAVFLRADRADEYRARLREAGLLAGWGVL